ncbi:MAG: cell division protein ZapA [Gammaproteobacteria bacterium]
MSEELARVTVRILDKEYQVACPDNEREALLQSAELLNRKMHEIRESGKVVGLDRVAVMAALNLSHEILQAQTAANEADGDLLGRLRALNDRLAGAGGPSLAHQHPLA